MSNLEKLNRILSNKKSTWQEEAKWREKNEAWLTYSFQIAMRILETLRNRLMTQKELAMKMNVSPQFINKVVKGKENLSLETITKLEKALEIKLLEKFSLDSKWEHQISLDQALEIVEADREQVFAQASVQDYSENLEGHYQANEEFPVYNMLA